MGWECCSAGAGLDKSGRFCREKALGMEGKRILGLYLLRLQTNLSLG